ncbi:hypothetical protein OJ253_1453 [Cryptosporidium canis]|uniref:Uncharacterized protein n=1 Tax=Cryptosporidium canis TaxID=195482 RepID=A0A9D5DMH5_9CRYT|nr:hypothetical protein OJ253_1453 [Cryptosporidium canis]
MSQNPKPRRGAEYVGGGLPDSIGGSLDGSSGIYEDRIYCNTSDWNSLVFQSHGNGQMGYSETQSQNSRGSSHAMMEDGEMGGGSSQRRMDHMTDGTLSGSNIGSLSGSRSSIGSQGQPPGPPAPPSGHSFQPTSQQQYGNPVSSSSAPSSPQFQQRIPGSMHQFQAHGSIQTQSSSRAHSVSPSPSPPSSPNMHSCQYNGGYPARVSFSQGTQQSPPLSPNQSSKYPPLSQPPGSPYSSSQQQQLQHHTQSFQVSFQYQPGPASQPGKGYEHSQKTCQNPPAHVRSYNIPMEKMVWDYLHVLYRQNTVALGYLTPYVDESFNVGKFHCMVTEFCKRQRTSRDALIIHAKNWFKDYIQQYEAQNAELTLESEISKYVASKIKRYENLGFRLESEKIAKFFCRLIPFMIRGLWRRLEEASFQRVDWDSKSFLGNEADPRFCNYEMLDYVMRLNEYPPEMADEDGAETGTKMGRHQDHEYDRSPSNDLDVDPDLDIDVDRDHDNDPNSRESEGTGYSTENMDSDSGMRDGRESGNHTEDTREGDHDRDYVRGGGEEEEDPTKEMVIVSRTQKWLLRKVKLEDFRHLFQMDQLIEGGPPRGSFSSRSGQVSSVSIRLPRKTQRAILDYMNLCHNKL